MRAEGAKRQSGGDGVGRGVFPSDGREIFLKIVYENGIILAH